MQEVNIADYLFKEYRRVTLLISGLADNQLGPLFSAVFGATHTLSNDMGRRLANDFSRGDWL